MGEDMVGHGHGRCHGGNLQGLWGMLGLRELRVLAGTWGLLRALGTPGRAAAAALGDPGGGSGAAAQGPPALEPQPGIGLLEGNERPCPQQGNPSTPGVSGAAERPQQGGESQTELSPSKTAPQKSQNSGIPAERSF